MATTPDVVIVGAGVMGCGTAYWLTQAGYHVLMLEQESVAHGASGMASAMLESVGHGTHVRLDDPLTELAEASFAQHQIWGRLLPEETGIDTGYREHAVFIPSSPRANGRGTSRKPIGCATAPPGSSGLMARTYGRSSRA